MESQSPQTVNVSASVKEIKERLRTDREFLIQFFLQDELTFPVPDFHKIVFDRMVSLDVERFACAIPRGHAKTTLAKLAMIYYFLFTDFRFIIYVSNTATVAVSAVTDVMNFLQSPNFISVFGPINVVKYREGEGFYKFYIGDKLCIVRALGAGQQVRGLNIDNQRPELLIVDDLEDNENTDSEFLQKKLRKWFYGPLLKCLDPVKRKVIQIGNMIANVCLLQAHCESDNWYSIRMGALLNDGIPLWPEVWSIEALKKDFMDYLNMGMIDVWYAEMMNLPMSAGRGLIRADQIHYRPTVIPPNIEYGFITIDLAISKQTWAHKTAIVVHGWIGDCWQIVDYVLQAGMEPQTMFAETIRFCFKWQVGIVGIETVAFQAVLKPVFESWAFQQGIRDIAFVELMAQQKKSQRLVAWCIMLANQQYACSENDAVITTQLLNFDPTKENNDDDLIDSCAHGPQMIDRYGMAIMNTNVLLQPPGRCITLAEIAEV